MKHKPGKSTNRKRQRAAKKLFLAKRQAKGASVRIGRIIAFVIVILVCAVPAFFINSIIGYLPVLTIAILLVLCRLYLWQLQKSLEYTDESMFSACERETEMAFSLHVRNRSVLVFPHVELQIVMKGPFKDGDSKTDTAITLAPREERTFTFDVLFDHLGTYSVGLGRVAIRGPLGVFSMIKPGITTHTVEVTPHVWEIDTLSLSEDVNMENSKAKKSAEMDGMDYSGVRPYAVGDPIKNIHWKLSAHMREYVTRQTEVFGNTGLTTVVDLCAPGEGDAEERMTLFDTLVETAVAVCNYSMRIGMDCQMLYLDPDGQEGSLHCRTKESFEELIHVLPPLKSAREEYPVGQLLQEAAGLHGQNNIVLCTARIEEETLLQIRQIRFRGFWPMVFFVVPKGLDPRESEMRAAPLRSLDGTGIRYFVLTSPQELQLGEF